MRLPLALDLFCKAGGATKGLQSAGFYVVGVDIEPQSHYCGDEFIQADALEYLDAYIAGKTLPGRRFDFIWASPPCQAYTSMRALGKGAGKDAPDLVDVVRERLVATGVPFTIENVPGAPLRNPLKLCGSMFGLSIRRHRLFESSFLALGYPCTHDPKALLIAVYGDHPEKAPIHRRRGSARGRHDGPREFTWRAASVQEASEAMGIDWMNWRELTQAVPPAYSEYIGRFAMRLLEQRAEQRPLHREAAK